MSDVLELFDVVRVREPLAEEGLPAGAVGTIVDLLDGSGTAYEVEVVDQTGHAVFAGAIPAAALELVSKGEH